MEITWDLGGIFLLVLIVAVAVAALGYLSHQNRRASSQARSRHEFLISTSGVKEPVRVPEPLMPPEGGSRKIPIITGPAEKRKALRRKGNHTPILLSYSGNLAQAVPAVVLDRSTGGLGVWAPQDAAVGMRVQVRPVDAPEELPWFTLEVRHTRPRNGKWFLGLKFENKLPWGQLLYFG